MKDTLQSILKVLTPSWVVTVVGITAGVFLLSSVIGVIQYTSSDLKPQIEAAREDDQTFAATNNLYANFSGRLAENDLLNTAPLFLTWAAVGLAIYFAAIAIVKAFTEVEELREELGYVHTSRRELLREAAGHFGIRVGAIAGWFLFIEVSWRIIIPYAVSLSSIIVSGITFIGIICALAAIAVVYAMVYVHAIFLRLITLRQRVFG